MPEGSPAKLRAVPRVVVLTDRFPELSETFVANEARALRRAGAEVRIEALAHGAAPRGEPSRVWEDETTGERLRAVAALTLRHPLRVLADLAARRRWRREEPVHPLRMLAPAARRLDGHLHVHFAAGAALAGLRIARITGARWSVTAHAYEIYQRPANLREKLTAARFATSGCDYTVRDLRRIAPDADVHVVVMGVDGSQFRRGAPYPGGRVVVAVGRLVEKKGFGDLIRAVALMAQPPDRLVIAGDGPLRPALERLAGEEGVALELPGALDPGAVRNLLEQADVLAMPSVVARDGDRDSMPVVVKEALAMEVPVVATAEVGLPEIVAEPWGRLVPPRDAAALAAALDALLALPADERAAMGRAGRQHVLERADVDREAAKLLGLIGRTQA